MQIQVTVSLASGVLYGDGAQEENIAKMTGIAVVLDVNKVCIEDRAEILGNKYENGVLVENGRRRSSLYCAGLRDSRNKWMQGIDLAFKRPGAAL